MNEVNGFDITSPAADAILLHLELDFGLEMAELAMVNMQFGSWEEYQLQKEHALDALASIVATANRLGTIDGPAVVQLHELAYRASAL